MQSKIIGLKEKLGHGVIFHEYRGDVVTPEVGKSAWLSKRT